MSEKKKQLQQRLLVTLALSSATSLFLLLGRVLVTHQFDYWFLAWNLFLCWLPLAFAWWLMVRLRKTSWLGAGNIFLTFLWLGFLPNAFYIASDIIHLRASDGVSLLYDVVMLLSFTFNGFLLGYLSLAMVHGQLKRRVKPNVAGWLIASVLLLCSFAIYLGRYLRWNSWDIIINPAGLIFDVSEPFINPGSHPQVFTTTAMFFILLGSIYVTCYQLVKIARAGGLELDS